MSLFTLLALFCLVLLMLASILALGAWIGIRASGKRVTCIVWLHRWVPMTKRNLDALGVRSASPDRQNSVWAFHECTDCGRPAIRRRSDAKPDMTEAPSAQDDITGGASS